MDEHILKLLLAQTPDRSLDGLEQAVWRDVAARRLADRRLGGLASVQIAMFVVTLIASAVVGGMATTQALAETPALGVFSTHSILAPSSLLVGG